MVEISDLDIHVSGLEKLAINVFSRIDYNLFGDMGPGYHSMTLDDIREGKLESYVRLIDSYMRNGKVSQGIKKLYKSSPCRRVQLYTFYVRNMIEKISRKK